MFILRNCLKLLLVENSLNSFFNECDLLCIYLLKKGDIFCGIFILEFGNFD